MPHVNALDSDMHHSALEMTGMPMRSHAVHELSVAHAHLFAINSCADALSSHLLGLLHCATIGFMPKGFAQRLGDGVGREAFHVGGEVEQFVFAKLCGMNGYYAECAARECACLVEHHGCCFGQCIDVVATFDENALSRGTADTAKEGERDREYQCAGARHYKKRECAVKPQREATCKVARKQRRKYGQRQCQVDYDGRIDLGEACYECFAFRLVG